jgi:hypothetical protein
VIGKNPSSERRRIAYATQATVKANREAKSAAKMAALRNNSKGKSEGCLLKRWCERGPSDREDSFVGARLPRQAQANRPSFVRVYLRHKGNGKGKGQKRRQDGGATK